MKKFVQKEVDFCDSCGKETYVDACLECGIEHCHKCRQIYGVEFKHAVHFSGSGDGYYCNYCIGILSKTRIKSTPLYVAYLTIAELRKEEESWYKDFKLRSDNAESTLKQLSPQ